MFFFTLSSGDVAVNMLIPENSPVKKNNILKLDNNDYELNAYLYRYVSIFFHIGNAIFYLPRLKLKNKNP